MSTEDNKVAQTPAASPEAEVEFVNVDIVESKEPSAKAPQELNGAKMNC